MIGAGVTKRKGSNLVDHSLLFKAYELMLTSRFGSCPHEPTFPTFYNPLQPFLQVVGVITEPAIYTNNQL